MADKTITTANRPTMGTSASKSFTVAPVKGAKSAVKKGYSKGGFLEAATATPRRQIQENMGAQLHPTATLYTQNAAEASQVLRNTRIVPSASGYKDFRAARSAAI
jgi:hypothetical protein